MRGFTPAPWLATGAACAALAPSSAFAVDYMSADQAAQSMFPQAERFESRDVVLDAQALQRLDASGVRARSARWTVRVAKRGSETLGYVVVDEVIGKFELITYAVGLSTDGAVRQVEVLSYRESHGHEIRLPAWRRQFVGKTVSAPLRVGDDIANISGATLSCTHVTDGVRRIVAVIDWARKQGALS
jgi:Na+-translocating ferredoxin:NAD+ oxidoreductase RnfG subunit